METYIPISKDSTRTIFLNFLRGMETGCVGHASGWAHHFLNFLRGMETQLLDELRPLTGAFLNFLRGMETF